MEDRGVAQLGSAPASGAGGRWFKSSRPDQFPSWQLGVVGASDCPPVGILPGPSHRDANAFVDVAIVTDLGHARNAIVVRSSHAVIALPGEYGTLSR